MTDHGKDTTGAHQPGQPIQARLEREMVQARDRGHGVVATRRERQIRVEDVSVESPDSGGLTAALLRHGDHRRGDVDRVHPLRSRREDVDQAPRAAPDINNAIQSRRELTQQPPVVVGVMAPPQSGR